MRELAIRWIAVGKARQDRDCAGCSHTFVFPAARDIFSGHLSIAAEQTNEASSVWFGAPHF